MIKSNKAVRFSAYLSTLTFLFFHQLSNTALGSSTAFKHAVPLCISMYVGSLWRKCWVKYSEYISCAGRNKDKLHKLWSECTGLQCCIQGHRHRLEVFIVEIPMYSINAKINSLVSWPSEYWLIRDTHGCSLAIQLVLNYWSSLLLFILHKENSPWCLFNIKHLTASFFLSLFHCACGL